MDYPRYQKIHVEIYYGLVCDIGSEVFWSRYEETPDFDAATIEMLINEARKDLK
jgi:hypothetical protein